MNIINLNQEWNFVVAETHDGKPNEKDSAKREILFALQILLARIGLATKTGEKDFSKQNYSALKEIYFTQK